MCSAMEMRVRSSLNPNAEPFIPMAYRLVEDFSPLWWELVKTSPWFQDYWSTHHRFDDDEADDDLQDLDDVDVDDLWVDDVNDSSLSSSLPFDFSACERKLQNGAQIDVVDTKAMLKKLNLGIPNSIGEERGSKYQGPASYYKNKKQQQQPTKYAAPKSIIRRIQQPR